MSIKLTEEQLQKRREWFDKEIKLTEASPKRTVYSKGDVVWCDFGYGVGSEIEEPHPAVILSNNDKSTNRCVIVVPATSSKRIRYYDDCGIATEDDYAQNLDARQTRCIDKRRIISKAGHLDGFDILDWEIAEAIGLGDLVDSYAYENHKLQQERDQLFEDARCYYELAQLHEAFEARLLKELGYDSYEEGMDDYAELFDAETGGIDIKEYEGPEIPPFEMLVGLDYEPSEKECEMSILDGIKTLEKHLDWTKKKRASISMREARGRANFLTNRARQFESIIENILETQPVKDKELRNRCEMLLDEINSWEGYFTTDWGQENYQIWKGVLGDRIILMLKRKSYIDLNLSDECTLLLQAVGRL